jgi:peptidoglycan hydrolase CwlO-like protein
MSRHADELERLCTKLNSRYGELDPLVLQVQAELETCKNQETSLVKAQDSVARRPKPTSIQQRDFTGNSS